MNKETYIEQRNELLEKAQQLINEGKISEFNDIKAQIEKLDNDYEEYTKAQANLNSLQDNHKITDIQNKSVNVKGGKVVASTNNNVEENFTNKKEYRKAFMNYVLHNEPISVELKNQDANTKTSDVGEMIPETVLEQIIEKMEATGMILPLVTRTAYKGGVKVPTSSAKPSASWVNEGAGSDKQKKATSYISFTYNKLRCAVSVSLEVDTMSLPVFERTLIANVSEAMVKEIEQAILTGSGNGEPKGILTETVATGQNVDIAKTGSPAYKNLIDAEAALPLAYENGAVWLMTKKTFMEYAGLTDSTGQPIGRVNYGLNGKIERMLLGRTVVCNDYMSNYTASPSADTIVAALFNMKDYILNTNLNMKIKKYEDNDTDDQVTIAIMLVDGKVVDKNSLVTITKKSS